VLNIAVWRILKKGCSTDFQTELKIGLREARERGGGGEGEPVRRLEGQYLTRGVQNTIMTDWVWCLIKLSS
jgi:hypothetical protein